MFGVQVTPTAEQLVTQPAPNSVPYILFYRWVGQDLTTSVLMWPQAGRHDGRGGEDGEVKTKMNNPKLVLVRA